MSENGAMRPASKRRHGGSPDSVRLADSAIVGALNPWYEPSLIQGMQEIADGDALKKPDPGNRGTHGPFFLQAATRMPVE